MDNSVGFMLGFFRLILQHAEVAATVHFKPACGHHAGLLGLLHSGFAQIFLPFRNAFLYFHLGLPLGQGLLIGRDLGFCIKLGLRVF